MARNPADYGGAVWVRKADFGHLYDGDGARICAFLHVNIVRGAQQSTVNHNLHQPKKQWVIKGNNQPRGLKLNIKRLHLYFITVDTRGTPGSPEERTLHCMRDGWAGDNTKV